MKDTCCLKQTAHRKTHSWSAEESMAKNAELSNMFNMLGLGLEVPTSRTVII